MRGSTTKLDKRSGRYSVAFPLIQPNPAGTLAWSIPNSPPGADISFDLVSGSKTVLRGVRNGATTPSVPAGDDYAIANVTGDNGYSAYFEVSVTYSPPGT